jgi:iduronate 2-sulfatase
MKLSRRDVLAMGLATPFASLIPRKKSSQTNVLMFSIDDLNTRIGCYGDSVVKTPNLDRLAQRSVRFERAYCTYPVCNASRTSLLSGFRPERTRVWDNNTLPRTSVGDVAFLPEYFKAHGYFTARVGKVAHHESFVKWDISENDSVRPPESTLLKDGAGPSQTVDGPQAVPWVLSRERAQRPRPRNERGPQFRVCGVGHIMWAPTSNSDAQSPDGATARRIVQIIGENKDKPFFIACGFRKPHLPFWCPKKYFDMYNLADIQLPPTPANDLDDIPHMAQFCTNRDNFVSDEDRRRAILGYYAVTTFMDAQIGIVLDAVDQYKLWDNTVVILWADHGWHLHNHQILWGKMNLFEEATHVPLIVHAPGKLSHAASPRLVEWVDIYPTLADLCGLPRPPAMEGVSLAPLLSDPQRPWKRAAYTLVWRGEDRFGRSLRTERYRYTEWDEGKGGSELFDHSTDPYEWTNLAGNPKAAEVQADLQQLLRNGQKTNLPPGA